MFFRPETKPLSIISPTVRPLVNTIVLEPRAESLAAISRIQSAVPGTEADFADNSYPRTITTTNRRGLLPGNTLRKSGGIARHARKLVDQKDIVAAFDLGNVQLRLDKVEKQTDGSYRVDFKQILTIAPDTREYRVRYGNVQVYMSKRGRIDQISSSARHAPHPTEMGKIISADEAVAVAKKTHGGTDATTRKAELSFSLHEGKFNPVYDVVLDSDKPKKKIFAYIVDAITGEVVYSESKLHFFGRRPHTTGVSCSTLLCVPTPDKAISDQAHDQILKWVDPKDPTTLGNDRYKVVIGADDKPVKANPDGSFKFKPDTSEFRAVANFFAVMFETELFESVGARVAAQYLLSVDNPEVVDNAYCDYINRTLKIGVGSGVDSGGLAKDESNDISICQHEAGHKFAGDEVAGGDLGGSQGAAMNEGTCGDGAYLVCNFLMRLIFGKEIGHQLTVDDIKNDGLFIGAYAMPPKGIRTQKNNMQAGKDETGEEHNDGLICGAATAEILVALATASGSTIEKGLRLYAQLYIKALNRLPKASSLTFSDLARAFITADQQVSKGANRKLIESCFARHNIKVASKV